MKYNEMGRLRRFMRRWVFSNWRQIWVGHLFWCNDMFINETYKSACEPAALRDIACQKYVAPVSSSVSVCLSMSSYLYGSLFLSESVCVWLWLTEWVWESVHSFFKKNNLIWTSSLKFGVKFSINSTFEYGNFAKDILDQRKHFKHVFWVGDEWDFWEKITSECRPKFTGSYKKRYLSVDE